MAGQTKLMLPSGGSVSISASDSTQNTTVTLPGGDVTLATTSQVMGRNRIINGAMMIDQRNAGAALTNDLSGTQFPVDRFAMYGAVASKFTAQQNAGSVTPPAGFVNYLGATSSSAYAVGAGENFRLEQRIEGLNVPDFGFGTANATAITISFWARSSLTGTFGGSVTNSGLTRSYPFTFSISAANTWEQKTVTIAGDTSGTWLTTNGIGLRLIFNLGSGSTYSGTAGSWATAAYTSATGAQSVVGTNGATFYITGVQLEKATTATPFEFRPYGQELALCQRYYQQIKATLAIANSSSNIYLNAKLLVPMRSSPSIGKTTGNFIFGDMVASSYTSASTPTIDSGYLNNDLTTSINISGFTGMTAYRSYRHEPSSASPSIITASSEL